MDYLEKGRELAKNGQHEEALEALSLAYENDKENPDVHFFIGLCYSSMNEYEYAKYYYEMALRFNPNHEKSQLMIGGLNNYTAKKPPEQRLIRKAQAEERRSQKAEPQQDVNAKPNEYELNPKLPREKDPEKEELWEEAFPTDSLQYDTSMPVLHKILIAVLLLGLLGMIVYFFVSVLLL